MLELIGRNYPARKVSTVRDGAYEEATISLGLKVFLRHASKVAGYAIGAV